MQTKIFDFTNPAPPARQRVYEDFALALIPAIQAAREGKSRDAVLRIKAHPGGGVLEFVKALVDMTTITDIEVTEVRLDMLEEIDFKDIPYLDKGTPKFIRPKIMTQDGDTPKLLLFTTETPISGFNESVVDPNGEIYKNFDDRIIMVVIEYK